MKKITFLFILLLPLAAVAQKKAFDENLEHKNVNLVLDQLNQYAAKADFNNYFDLFADQSTYIGTDASEIWNKKQFMDYAKPHFDKGQGWSFKSLKRNITFSKDGNYAWFDEILDTQMKICRGSGVLEKTAGKWEIKQYILSMTIPNNVAKEVITAKSAIETKQLEDFIKIKH